MNNPPFMFMSWILFFILGLVIGSEFKEQIIKDKMCRITQHTYEKQQECSTKNGLNFILIDIDRRINNDR